MFAFGLGAALLASALFNVGIALQGLEARAAPTRLGLRLGLLARLLRRPRWILGLILGLVGIGPQVVALAEAPFVVVQPALAVGLLLLLLLGAKLFPERVRAGEGVGRATRVAATLTGMTAFQRRTATTVVPVSTSLQTFLPIVLEPLFLREHWSSANLDGATIVAGLIVALVGTTLVSRARAVSDLIAGATGG